MAVYHALSGSAAEDLFIDLFSETFGAEKAGYLYSQYPFFDIYQNSRYADFLLENGGRKVAIEIDDETSHNKSLVSSNKFYDDLLKQNSMIYLGWDVYRWAVRQMQIQPEAVKDELRVFLGSHPRFREIEDYLPTQRGKTLDGAHLELKQHQREALDALQAMRNRHETIALLYHATGTGKTVTAVMDAKRCGGRTLFLAHTQELVNQAADTFRNLWPEVTVGRYMEAIKEPDAHVVCGSVQSVALHLEDFREDAFSYLIVDEAHHAAADTYQKILAYFHPTFTLGLTATPERTDDNRAILDIFKNTAHKPDIQTAVEIGELVPIRCIRIHTNIDLTRVRFNSVQYNIRDLESKIYVPERNRLIVDTWLQYVRNKRTVVFCASVRHAEEIAELFRQAGVSAAAVSGGMKPAERREFQDRFVRREILVLCACDLLNEGWDCPEIEVLFMARPTMSRVLYTQQLGRGMRLFPGKESLMVFDFVDNASQYNMPQSLHRLFKLKEYRPGQLAVAPGAKKTAEAALYAKGEKPEALIDWPVDATDYELVDIFNWQDEATGMISQMEFVRRVDVQTENIERYVREGKLVPDLVVPMSEHRTFKYFKEETLERYARQYGWTLID
ncbi:MAG TPA: DEAD/DEAH box helicase, partial [Subdoligranulum variabile]|nr:DEAD/DEAH box helicase [Subdoligranulum variabile]